MFRIDMLPAEHGDCIWIEYGDVKHSQKLLIDCGTDGTYERLRDRLSKMGKDERHFELLIITHIDGDHIAGALKLLNDKNLNVRFDDIWFNGWRHLPGSDFEDFGPVQGEKLTDLIYKKSLPWNKSFVARAVSIQQTGSFHKIRLPGGMLMTILSPGLEHLASLRPTWESECKKAGLDPYHECEPERIAPAGFEAFGTPDVDALAEAPFAPDKSKANGSSIAVLAEFDDRRALLAADGHADVLLNSIERLLEGSGNDRLKLDAFKVPHHGSKNNISKDFLERLDCTRYLFSTNGAYHRHPDKEAVARVLKYSIGIPQLIFNYSTKFNLIWDSEELKQKYGYSLSLPADNQSGQQVQL